MGVGKGRKEGGRKLLYLLAHSTDGCSARAGQAKEAGSFILVSHVDGKNPTTWAIFCHIPEPFRGN